MASRLMRSTVLLTVFLDRPRAGRSPLPRTATTRSGRGFPPCSDGPVPQARAPEQGPAAGPPDERYPDQQRDHAQDPVDPGLGPRPRAAPSAPTTRGRGSRRRPRRSATRRGRAVPRARHADRGVPGRRRTPYRGRRRRRRSPRGSSAPPRRVRRARRRGRRGSAGAMRCLRSGRCRTTGQCATGRCARPEWRGEHSSYRRRDRSQQRDQGGDRPRSRGPGLPRLPRRAAGPGRGARRRDRGYARRLRRRRPRSRSPRSPRSWATAWTSWSTTPAAPSAGRRSPPRTATSGGGCTRST